MNAFTTHEQTVFYVRVPDTRVRRSRSTSSPTSCGSPRSAEHEVESERQVILEEIGMRDDTPDDLVHELFEQATSSLPIRSGAKCWAAKSIDHGDDA